MAATTEGNDEAQARNRYAKLRTELANERTLLSYFRTGLGCALAGATVIHFLTGRKAILTGAGLLVSGSCLALFGFGRFFGVRRRIGMIEEALENSSTGDFDSGLRG